MTTIDNESIPPDADVGISVGFFEDRWYSDNDTTVLTGDKSEIVKSVICNYTQITSLEGGPTILIGDYLCSNNAKLVSLKGAPEFVPGIFDCSKCLLESLAFGPKKAYKFRCYYNKLTSLVGGPEYVTGDYDCSYNKLKNLLGAPTSAVSSFNCSCNLLETLIGAPPKVVGVFNCSFNHLTNFFGAPEIIRGTFQCVNNQFTNLHNIHHHVKYCEIIDLGNNPILSNVLGLLKIEGLMVVYLLNKEVQAIINKYLPMGDIFKCQEELIEAGFEDYAKI